MDEKIIIQGICNHIKGALVENGHGMLTNQRFIYSKHSLAKIAAMGVLVNLTQGSYEFEIPFPIFLLCMRRSGFSVRLF